MKKVTANNNFREMKKGTTYPIVSVSYAEDNISCPKGDMCIDISVIKYAHISNFDAAF